jgi:hypothetical protein
MRYAAAAVVFGGCMMLSSVPTLAMGRPDPITCPTDVALALAERCPCDGKTMPDDSVQPWRNHGQYVSCVVRFRNALRKAGCFTDNSIRRTLARCAARSTCGKSSAVRCCTYELATCNDPMPGDTVAEGTCSNDPALTCDSDADCTKSSARITRGADACTAHGGMVVEGGSVCEPCPPSAP